MRIYLASIVFVLISACADPYNKTISEFKKSKVGIMLFECAGVRSKYDYKLFTPSKEDRKTEASKDIAVLEVTVKKEFNDATQGEMRVQYDANIETYRFQPRFIEVKGIEALPGFEQFKAFCKKSKEY